MIVEKTEVNDRGPAAQGPVFAANQIPTLLRGPPTKTPSRLLLLGNWVLTPTKTDSVHSPAPVNQYEPKEKCIREQVGRNTKRVIKRERLEPNR